MKNNTYKILEYGLSWISPQNCNASYSEGSLDTVAHMAACFLAQEHNISVPTSDIRDIIREDMKADEIKQAFDEYLEDIRDNASMIAAMEANCG